MVTSEPVRDRMVALTRSMSAATRATSWSIDAAGWLSKGTTTATPVSTIAQFTLSSAILIETAARRGKGASSDRCAPPRPSTALKGERHLARTGSHQRYRAGLGDRRAAGRRPHPPSGAGPEHERDRGLAGRAAAAHPGA